VKSIHSRTRRLSVAGAVQVAELSSIGRVRRAVGVKFMTYVSLQHMPLAHAYLCQDCNCVGNCAVQCPACASEALMGLDTVLNRKDEERAQFAYLRVAELAAA